MSRDTAASSLQRAVAQMDAAGTARDVIACLQTYAVAYGLTHALAVVPPLHGNIVNADNIICGVPEDFGPQLLDDDRFFADFIVKQALATGLAVTWRDELAWRDGDAGHRRLLDILNARRMTGGLIVPALGATGMTGLVVLAGPRPNLDDADIALLKLVSVYAFDRACAGHRRMLRDKYALSDRELECMKWVAAGKTDWEIGQILEISPKTVNFHVENTKRKMAVPSRVQAVIAAVLTGGIEPQGLVWKAPPQAQSASN